MKKAILSMLLLASTAIAALAVPAGTYYDNRGNLKAIVSQNGKEIHLLDNQGNVRRTLTVTSERNDGTFTVNDPSTGITHSRNAYWTENGAVLMNLEWLPKTVTRK